MLQSIWEQESFYQKSDAIIIGSGLNGLWAALHLKEKWPFASITILERGSIPEGASTRNAGFACFGSAGELVSDIRNMGEEAVWNLVEMRFRGIQLIKEYFGTEEIGYETNGGSEIFDGRSPEKTVQVMDSLPALNRVLRGITGTSEVFHHHNELISSMGFAGISELIFNPLEAQLHSGKLVLALLKKVQSLGVRILFHFPVQQLEEQSNGVEVLGENGVVLKAGKVLVCTNGFAKQLLPELDVVPARGQVLVTAPIPQLRIKGCFHLDEGYYYFRNLGSRLLLGGARNIDFKGEETVEMNITPHLQSKLEELIAAQLLPHQPVEITHRWSGIMGMGTRKTPIVQAVSPHVYCCVRMSGMGVALAPVTAKKVIDAMYP